jgi:hypothetical protein
MPNTAGAGASALWRRAIQALAHAFDAGREAEDRDTVFQTSEARTRTELRATTEHSVDEVLHPKHQAKDTLQ